MKTPEQDEELMELTKLMFVQCCNQFSAAFVSAAKSGRFEPNHLANAIYGTIGSLAHQLPDSLWKEMINVKPCGGKGCECHITMKQFMMALDTVRERAKVFIAEREAERKGETTHEE